MKKTILFSTLVITQTILASTLTIYNSNLAHVSETRDLNVQTQTTKVEYKNIPSKIIQESVKIDFPNSVTLYSQTYTSNLPTINGIANKFIGKKVRYNKQYVTLLSVNSDTAVIKRKSNRISIVDIKNIEFDFLPENFALEPTLIYRIRSEEEIDDAQINLNYLTNGISFHNDYILDITQDQAKLTAWANINNNSGKDFKNADIKLVAGELNRVSNSRPILYRSNSLKNSTVTEKATNSYHTYDIKQQVDLYNNEEKRIKLFDITNLKIKNEYSALLNNPLYLFGDRSVPVSRDIKFKLSDKILPTGIVRVYSKSDNQTLFIGEDKVINNPKDTEVSLKVTKEFDTKVIQKVISRDDTKSSLTATIEYNISNHSDKTKEVILKIPFNKKTSSKINSDIPYRYADGKILFDITVEPNTDKEFQVSFSNKR